MTLRNAFGELSLEETQQLVLAAAEATLAELAGGIDVADSAVLAKLEAIRVLVDGTLDVNVTNGSLDVSVLNMIPDVETGLTKEVTLQLALAKLNDIFSAVDGLEVTAENISISADTIELSTDAVESLLQQIRDNAITAYAAASTAANQTIEIAKLEAIRLLLAGVVTVNDGHPDPLTNTELRATPVLVDLVQALAVDTFGNLLVGARHNQIEVHFDDADWATYGTEELTGGAPTGVQSEGKVSFQSGSGASGHHRFTTTDAVKYRPLHGVYGAATAAFVVPPTNGASNAYVWLLGEAATGNGVAVGYKGTTFGIAYWRGGAEVSFTPRASWGDPCQGVGSSAYTLDGTPVTMDPAKGQVYLVECGLLGYAGFTVTVLSPDQVFIPVFNHVGLNTTTQPIFSNFDLYQYVDITKSSGGTTNVTVHAACWAAGTTTDEHRLNDSLSDRSLAPTVRTVAWGKNPSGSYVPVGVDAAGRLEVSATVDFDASGLATEATLEAVRVLLAGGIDVSDSAVLAKLEAIRVLVDGTLDVSVTNMIAEVETGLTKEVTLQLALAKLNDIFSAVDGLEITADNIEINGDTLNLALDDVESLLQQIRDNAITADAGQATAANQTTEIAKLEAIRLLLAATLTVTGTVALDAPTLAALESITASISNWPSDFPDAAVLAKLEAIRALIDGTLDVADSAVLAKLETIRALVDDRLPASLGQKTKAESLAVTLASDQEISLPAGAATEAKQDDEIAALAGIQAELELVVSSQPGSRIDAGNSVPVTPLGANAESLGTPKYIEHAGSIIYLYAIQPTSEAPAAVQIQYSDTEDFAVVTSTTSLARKDVESGPFTYAVYLSIVNGSFGGKWYRSRVLNGAVAQTATPIAFATTNRFPFNGSFGALDAPLTFFSQGLLTRAVQAGLTFDGSFVNAVLPEHTQDVENSLLAPLSNGTITAFTVDEPNNLLLSVGHGLLEGDAVVLTTTGMLPAPTTTTTTTTTTGVQQETAYWVINPNADDFQITTNINAAVPTAVNFTDVGTGMHSYQKRGQFVGEFKDYSQVGSGLDFFLDLQRPAVLRTEWSANGTTVGDEIGGLFSTSARAVTVTSSPPLGDFYINIAVVQTMIAKYRRVRIVNGPNNQFPGLAACSTFIGKGNYPGSFGSLDADLNILSTALLTRAVQAGTRFDGSFENVAISEHDRDLQNEQAEPLVNGAPVVFTVDEPANTIESVAHGLVANQCVHVSSDTTLPAPLTATGHYFVKNPTDDDFQISTTRGGSAVNLTDTGTGIHSYKVAAEFAGEYTRISDIDHTEILYAVLGGTPAVVEKIWSGDGIRALDRTFADGVLNSTETLTSATEARFTRYDRGAIVTGTGIPAGTVILDIVSPTTVTLSNAATATATDVAIALNSSFDPSALTATELTGYQVYYDVAEGRNMAPYYKFHIVNGVADQTLFPGFIHIAWLVKTPYQGTFGLLSAALNQLSRALLVRSVQAGLSPDNVFKNLAAQGRSSANSTTAPLNGDTGGSDHIFRGEWIEWQENFVGMPVEFISDVAGTLYIDVSQETAPVDGTDDDVTDSITIAYDPVDGLFRRTFPLQSRWVRTRYVNGVTAQTEVALDTAFVVTSTATPLSPLATIPQFRSLGTMGQSVLLVPDQDDDTVLVHVPASEGVGGKRGLNTQITGQDRPLDISPVETLVTGAATISDAEWTPLPAVPLTERATICYSNLDEDLDVRISENDSKSADNGGVVFPRSSKEFDLGPGQIIYFRLSNQGVAENVQQIHGATAENNVGVVNPNNIKVGDGAYADFDASTDSLDVTAFSITPVYSSVKTVRLKLEAKAASTPTSEQVTWVDVQTGTAGNVTSVVSASVTAAAAHFYTVAISRKNTAAAVSSVTGMGLTWLLMDDITNGVDTRISVYYAAGTGATSGAVTASFSTAATNAVIAVNRFSGVKFSDPLGSHETLTGANTGSYSDSLSAGTDRGMSVVCVSARERTHTAGGTYTERNETQSTIGGGGASTAMEATETAPITATGAVAYSGTLSGNANWSLVAFTLNPDIVFPTARVRYKVGAEAYGATALTQLVTALVDTEYTAAVTLDRAWTFSDINALRLTVDIPSIGAIPLNIDRAWVEVIETNTGATARVCYEEIGGYPNS